MEKFKFVFNGRLVGAIGVSYGCSKEIESDSLENAILKLYDTHEHIAQLHFLDKNGEYFPVSYLYLDKKEGRDQRDFV